MSARRLYNRRGRGGRGRGRGQGHTPVTTLKILLLGDAGSGKSSLMHCFADEGAFSPDTVSTAGVDCRVKQVLLPANASRREPCVVALQIWDTAGQERFRTITHNYYRDACGVLLCFDVSSPLSFSHVDYWLQSIEQLARSGVIRVLVGNKIDLKNDRAVQRSEAEKLAAQHNIAFVETSAKTSEGVVEAFTLITELIMPNLELLEAAGRDMEQAPVRLSETRKNKMKACGAACGR